MKDEIIFRVIGLTGMADNSPHNIYTFVNDIWNSEGKYKITHTNNYTHLLVFNRVNLKDVTVPQTNIFGFQQEPPWSRHPDKTLTNKCKVVFTHTPHIYTNPSKTVKDSTICVHNLWPKNPDGRLMYDKELNTNKIVNSKFIKKEKLSISFSYYDVHSMGKGPGTLIERCGPKCYEHRNNLIRKLFKSDIDFSLYGARWNNALRKWGIKNDGRYKGFIKHKINTLKDFEYHLSIENDILEGQVSEKIADPILCKTIPIYFGAPDIEKYYNIKGIEILDGYDDNCIEKIKDIISTPYESYNKNVLEENIKNYRETAFNPFKRVIDYLNESN
jgi:hypothetical protein